MKIEVDLMPQSKLLDEEVFCTHLNAQKKHIEDVEGNNLLGQFRVAQWQYIKCPECRTEKVLVKAPTP